MKDKMPTNKLVVHPPENHTLYLGNDDHGGILQWYFGNEADTNCKAYTLVHNNPDYHVIKKSDVDGDVMGALGALEKLAHTPMDMNFSEWNKISNTIRNALIAQSERIKNDD